MNRFALPLLLGVATLVGCGNGITGGTSRDDQSDQGPNGRWILSILEPSSGAEYPVALFDVEDGETTPVEVGLGELIEDGDGVTEDGFDLQVKSQNDVVFSFRGKKVGDGYRGNGLVEGQPQVLLARLTRTDMPGLDGEKQILPGIDDLDDARRGPDSQAIRDFIEKRPSSPLVLAAHEALINFSERDEASDDEVLARTSAYTDEAGEWGERYQDFARLRAPLILASASYAPGVVRKLVDEAKESFDEDELATWQPIFDSITEKLELADAKIGLASDDEAESDAASAKLDEMRIEDPTRGEVTYLLAADAAKKGEDERALKLFGELVALPGLERSVWRAYISRGVDIELPSDRFAALWKKLHGEDADSTEFLDAIYEDRAFYFRGEPAPPRTEGNRTVLVELFTGAECPPCVAADVAVGAVEQVYPPEQVIALRYHQHIPGPDPFANSASETRFSYYSGRGTPTTAVDGRPVGIGGGLELAAASYEQLVEAIEPDLNDETPVSLSLEATPDGQKIAIKATASGVDESASEVRLRIVLAETLVHFKAQNGIRLHEMVVRDMPGGAKGVVVSEGSATFEKTVDLAAVKRGLKGELADFEETTNLKISEKPMPFEGMHVVAFVQDDTTKEVLQARAVPVGAADTEPPDDNTEKPDPVESPEPSQKPEPTEKPEPTAKPEPTEEPEPAEEPKPEPATPEGEGDATTEAPDGDAEPAAATENTEKEAAAAPAEGAERWILMIEELRSRREFPIAILDVVNDETKVVEVAVGEVEKAEITDKGFHLRTKDDEGDFFDFAGTNVKGDYRGNGVIERFPQIWMVRLVRAEAKSLETIEPDFIDGIDAFEEALQNPDSSATRKFAKENPTSPLAIVAAESLLAASRRDESPDDEVRKRSEEYVDRASAWGSRYADYARVRASLLLARSGHAPGVAKELAETAEKKLNEMQLESWKPLLDEAAERIELAEATAGLASDDEAARKAALATLERLHEEDPSRGEITYLLAGDASEHGEKEKALALYGELLALPGMERSVWQSAASRGVEIELPSESFAALWEELEKDEAELDPFLDELYEKRAFYFADEKSGPRTSGNRVSLVELFTGTMCPPCVAADVAVGAIEKAYGPDQVVALRYHQHIPGPDPFANSKSEVRFDYYAGRGTPTTVLNGQPLMVGGDFSSAQTAYEELQQALKPYLDDETPVDITIETEGRGEQLKIKATATGLDPENTQLRLRIVLAETLVHHPARNGVRLHEMVVRDIPSGVEGIPQEGGSASFEKTLELPGLKQNLMLELAQFEAASNQRLASKPMPFESVHVVAFVQDDATKQVLQAKIVGVEGKLSFDAAGPALEAPAGEKPDDADPDGDE